MYPIKTGSSKEKEGTPSKESIPLLLENSYHPSGLSLLILPDLVSSSEQATALLPPPRLLPATCCVLPLQPGDILFNASSHQVSQGQAPRPFCAWLYPAQCLTHSQSSVKNN